MYRPEPGHAPMGEGHDNEIRSIVIAGGGTAGWMTAALFAYHLPRERYSVRLIESEEIGTIGVGESTIPPFLGLIRNLGINEQDFIAQCQASFKLGIQFRNWKQKGEDYFHPFGQIGANVDSVDFYQAWLKAKLHGHPSALQDFASATVMAANNRFMLPQKAARTPIASANYALHVDARLVAKYLRRHAEDHGTVRTEGMIAAVNLNHDDGHIRSLTLRSGEEIAGDLFVDCTGFRALLIGGALKVGYTSWADELFCDRAIAVQTENADDPHPYTLAEAQDFGWRWRIPLQHRAGNGYVYSSQYISDEDATASLLSQVKGKVLVKPMVVPFTTGIRKEVWHKNCLSLGLASGFIEPLESTAIHLVYRTLDFFFRFFPDKSFDPALMAEFNRRIFADYEEVKDFIVLHYCLTQREDTEFWRRCKTQDISDNLRRRIDVFKASGSLLETGPEELFKNVSWYSVLDGMGIMPPRGNLMADKLNVDSVIRLLDEVRPPLEQFVKTLPTHGDFLKSFCPAPEPV